VICSIFFDKSTPHYWNWFYSTQTNVHSSAKTSVKHRTALLLLSIRHSNIILIKFLIVNFLLIIAHSQCYKHDIIFLHIKPVRMICHMWWLNTTSKCKTYRDFIRRSTVCMMHAICQWFRSIHTKVKRGRIKH
jgi:hypothetical protein